MIDIFFEIESIISAVNKYTGSTSCVGHFPSYVILHARSGLHHSDVAQTEIGVLDSIIEEYSTSRNPAGPLSQHDSFHSYNVQ